jgi:hypothetical protein
MNGEEIVKDALFFNDNISDEAKDLVGELLKTDPQ